MANFKAVNAGIRKAYPNLDIELVRGVGYAYLYSDTLTDQLPSIMAHPTSTSTADMLRLALEEIEYEHSN